MSSPTDNAPPVPSSPPRAITPQQFVLLSLAGAFLGLLVVLLVMRRLNYDPTPSLTPALFAAAHERWKAAPPPNYDIEIRVTGSQPALYKVEVRGGDAQAAWRNGEPLKSRRTFGTWSVPGMFNTISRDIEALERHAQGTADRATPRLTLRAEFDSQYSYPAKYRRIEQWSHVEVAWQVTSFRVLQPGSSDATGRRPMPAEANGPPQP